MANGTGNEIVFVDVGEDNECTNEKCITEIQSLLKEISDLEAELIEAKNMYHELLVLNMKKDLMIDDLEIELKKLQSRYDTFSADFSAEIVATLTSIDDSEEKDTFFMRTALAHLYRDDLSKLKGKTYSGRTKEAISPDKKETLRKLFNKRTECVQNQQKRSARNKNIGKIIKNAIEIINKSN